MEQFEAILKASTGKDSNVVPGAVVAVIDKEGNYIYKNVQGTNGILPDAPALEFDQTYYIASCTKLIASIAALQIVERGLITLDDPLDTIIPEFTSQPVIQQTGSDATSFSMQDATKSITLRHLVTHSSGSAYEIMSPLLTAWRASRGEDASLESKLVGPVAEKFAFPRLFEAGEGWMYGGGLDWASLVVARLTKIPFGQYVEENIAKPLGIESFTWRPSTKASVKEKLMRISSRGEDGGLVDGPNPFVPESVDEAGGAGLYANVHDYTRVLADLLREDPVLLKKDTVDQMFSPQLGPAALKGLNSNSEWTWGPTFDHNVEGVVLNHGLGGLLVMEDVEREDYFKPKGTLTWSGMPNLVWSINREKGIALMLATQVMPWADKKAWHLNARFETAVWRNLAK